MLHDVHGEIYGGVEYSQQAVHWADTENGRWRSRKWRGHGGVWDMKWQSKALVDWEDALLRGHHCTIGVLGMAAGMKSVQNYCWSIFDHHLEEPYNIKLCTFPTILHYTTRWPDS